MKLLLLGFFALGLLAKIQCEFVYQGPDRNNNGGHVYSYNGGLVLIPENDHRVYQLNRANAERNYQSKLRDGATENRHSYDENQWSQKSPSFQNGNPSFDINKSQSPTREEVANSQVVSNFRPNKGPKPASSSGPIVFPNNFQLNNNDNLPYDPNSLPTESTGFNRKIPANRERESVQYPSNAITNFAWNLFRYSNSQSDYVLSPLSPQVILSYLAWVADGATRQELIATNGFGNPNQIQEIVQSMLADPSGRELQIATGVFYSADMRLNQEFFDKSVKTADVLKVDFRQPAVAGRTISRWAKSKTKGGLKLDDLSFSPSTKVALTSAIYFKGTFIYTFEDAQPGYFNSPSGRIQSKMMNMKRKFNWGRLGNSAEWVAIPYKSNDMLVIILPNKGKSVDDVISSVNPLDIGNMVENVDSESTKANVNVTLPKFKLESTTNLVDPLQRMGINTLFTPRAQLPYFSDYDAVQVTNAQQQASLDVNEEGTVLIAFTNFNVVALSFHAPVPDVEFNVDRPFIAMIVDTSKNIPYVFGKISSPSA